MVRKCMVTTQENKHAQQEAVKQEQEQQQYKQNEAKQLSQIKNNNLNNNTCDACDQHFTRCVNLLRHKRGVHQKEDRVQCQICKKSFALKDILQEHLARSHNIELG
jgi:uncharacterized Zn-finger protein